MIETWKEIEGYNDYLISDLGRVISLKNGKTKILKNFETNIKEFYGCYYGVTLYNKNFSKRFDIQRLVAIAFIPNSNNKPIVNHKDRHKTNNCVENLEWVTPSENALHSAKMKRKMFREMGYIVPEKKTNYLGVKNAI